MIPDQRDRSVLIDASFSARILVVLHNCKATELHDEIDSPADLPCGRSRLFAAGLFEIG
jgi:hypothetical protein